MSSGKPSPITRPGRTARIGETIAGRYELIRLLGSGGMGAVYEARHGYTGKKSALKLLHPRIAGSPEGVKRFLREAQAQSSIGHPNIVEVLDAGVAEDGSLYLVFELLEGQDLGKRMKEQPLSIPELVEVSLQVLDALAVAHQKGFVHRDIKPENVFLLAGDELRVKLLDFGIAKRIGNAEEQRLTTTGAAIGTPVYMSPEQARGVAVDARTDLWSMGALLFRSLTGKPPFQADNYNALVLKIATEPVPRISQLRPEVPAELAAIIDRALMRELEERWASAGEMAAALRAFRVPAAAAFVPGPELTPVPGDRTLGEERLSQVEATIAQSSSRKLVIAAIVVPILITAIAGAVLLSREGPPAQPAPASARTAQPSPEPVREPVPEPAQSAVAGPAVERAIEPAIEPEPRIPAKATRVRSKPQPKRAEPPPAPEPAAPKPAEEPPAKRKYEPLRSFGE